MKIRKVKIMVSSIMAVLFIASASVVSAKFLLSRDSGKGGLEMPGPDFDTEKLDVANDLDVFISSDFVNDSSMLSYQSYRVEAGDMVGAIASRFGITQDTVISMNNIRQSRLLQVGQYLKIPNMAGILYTVKSNGETVESVSESYKVDAAKCALVNNVAKEESLKAGMTLFVPDAALDWVTRQEINGDLFSIPLRCRYYFSSYYGWRSSPFSTGKRSFHGGVDMAVSSGTSIYPALAGKVIAASFNTTYGNYVIIAHHSGYQTLYGHMSAILAVTGKYVTTSDCIGKVGNTGLSTGPHLHFAVYKNGKSINPMNLVK